MREAVPRFRRLHLLHSRAAAGSALLLGLFLLLMLLIGLGLAKGVDLGVARTVDATLGPIVEPWFRAVATLWSPELSILYGLVAAVVLWRRGWGLRFASPLAFLLLVPVEVALKYALHRPPMPVSLKDWPPYPWVNPTFGGSDGGGYYLSGSAMRTAFFCLLLAVVLWGRGGGTARLLSAVAAAVTLLFGLIRVFGGYHWLTAELSGQLLGASLALVVGWWMAEASASRSKLSEDTREP